MTNKTKDIRDMMTNDSSSECEEEEKNNENINKYAQKPSDGIFKMDIIKGFLQDVKKNDASLITTPSDYLEKKRKFNKNALKRFNFVQYNYKTPIKFAYVSNVFGICVSNSEDFTNKTTMTNLNSLEAKHRVSVLLPSVKNNWHTESTELFTKIFDGFVEDLRKLNSKSNEFKDNLSSQNIKISDMKQLIEKLRTKHVTGTTTYMNSTKPTVFGVKLFTTQVPSVKINCPVMELKSNKFVESKWKKLAKPVYMHSINVIKLTGFKITKTGISLDLCMDFMGYTPIEEQAAENNKRSAYFLSEYVVQAKKAKKDDDNSSDSDDGECNEDCQF